MAFTLSQMIQNGPELIQCPVKVVNDLTLSRLRIFQIFLDIFLFQYFLYRVLDLKDKH